MEGSGKHHSLPTPSLAQSSQNDGHAPLRHNLTLTAAIASLGILMPGAAFAQDAATAQSPAPGDIVVTAQRDKSLASKTPLSITAISGKDLLKSGVTNTVQLADQVPNVEINRYYGLQITIRGVTNGNQTSSGDPSAAFLLDGVYIARPQEQEVSFYDVDRVEVLRGPQGTLYGRNTTAGLINVITNHPSDKFEMAGNIGYGNYNAVQADAMVNVPVSDEVAFRLAGAIDRRDSYFVNAPGDTYNANPFTNNKSLRLSGKFAISDNVTLLLMGDYTSVKGNNQIVVDGTSYYDLTNTTTPTYKGGSADQLLQRGFSQQMTPHVNDKVYGVTAQLDWNLGPLTATYLGSYRWFDQNEDTTDYSGQVSPTLIVGGYQQDSQELRFSVNDVPRVKFQFGGMYFYEKSHQHFDQPNYFGYDHYILNYDDVATRSYALFGQGTYSLTDRLRLTAGVRYSHDDKSRFGHVITESTVYGDASLLDAASAKFAKTTWRLGVDYDLNRHNMIYASVATGYKAGSFNDGCQDGAVVRGETCNYPLSASQLYYQPETLTAYEIGVKGRTDDGTFQYTLAGFYYDYKNLQVNSVTYYSGAATVLTQNAAKARVEGVEAQVTLRPSHRNQFDLSYNWLHARYLSYQPDGADGPDYSGYPLDRSPTHSVTASYTYTLPLPNDAGLSFNARSKLSSDYSFLNTSTYSFFRQPGYTRTDVSLTYNAPGNRWYIQGYAHNLENQILVTGLTYFAGALAVIPSDPRTYGVRAGFKF